MKTWRVDLTGQKFSRLTALEYSHNKGRNRMWKCLCECGNTSYVSVDNLRRAAVRSCGCLRDDIINSKGTHHEAGVKNKTKEYRTWVHIKTRCFNKNDKTYASYGGKGVTMSDSWAESYDNFLIDMGRAPSPKHSIERIDNTKGYYKGNCKWATSTQQVRNRSTTVMVNYNGVRRPLYDLCEELGLNAKKVYKRIHEAKWPIEKAIL